MTNHEPFLGGYLQPPQLVALPAGLLRRLVSCAGEKLDEQDRLDVVEWSRRSAAWHAGHDGVLIAPRDQQLLSEVEQDFHRRVAEMLEERERARKAKDFAKADAIRARLLGKGVEVFDDLHGPRWRYAARPGVRWP